MLRLRTSPEFRVARSFGQLFPDPRYDSLAHIVACDANTTFAFDLEFTRAAGFSDASDNPPMLQAAFQYSVAVPAAAADPSHNGGGLGVPAGQRWDLISQQLNNVQLTVLTSDILRSQANPALWEFVLYQHRMQQVAARPSPQKPVTLRTCPVCGCLI
jgi:hypothetical protein